MTQNPVVEGTLDALSAESDVLIEAGPGSGKTYTITRVTERLEGHSVLVATYSKRLEQEIAPQLPRFAVCGTLHSIGYRILQRCFPDLGRPDKRKSQGIAGEVLAELYGRRLSRDERRLADELGRLHDLREVTLDSALGVLERLKPEFDGDRSFLAEALEGIERAAQLAFETQGHLSFSEMLTLPLRLGVELPRFGVVAIDECQDLSRAALDLVRALGKRLLLVGDRHQAIFGFAGADEDSVPRIVRELRPTTLALPVCRRSSVAVVDFARRIYPVLEAMPDAAPGQVGCVPDLSGIPDQSMVLGRNNAPLLAEALKLLRGGRSVRLEGRDVVAPVLSALQRVEREVGFDFTRCAPSLGAYYHKVQGDEALRQALLLIAHVVDAGARSLEEVSTQLLGQVEDAEITLSTMHKSKGLEARHVYVLLPEKPQEDTVQERNLRFVAATRAQETMHFVGSEAALERWLVA